MARTSPCFYIAPTAISVSPNANGSASDIAVNVVRGAKIKVYSPGVPALGYSDVSFQQWTLTGRNRRLADNTKPYSIYARLAKSNKEDGYLVFAPKVASGTEWLDKYAYVTVGGLATGTANKNSEDYWYVKLGDVSLPTNNARAVTLDTGILGTDKFNTDWNIDPDQMPLRIELSATIDAKDAGDKPYVEWDKVLTLKANLLEGWANANVQRFHHFTIQRNTGDTSSDKTYNYPPEEKSDSENPSSGRKMPNGSIPLSHARGTGDVFNGTVSSIWTVIAWGLKANVADNTSSSSSTSGTVTANVYEKLAEKSINIMAETGEQYALEMSSSVVNYDPSSGTYNPANGIDVMVRATDQRGKVFKLTNAQLGAANLVVQYSLEDAGIWNDCVFTDTDTANPVAKANIPITAFEAQKNVNVRIVKAHYLEIYRSHIAFIRKGEKGDKGDPGTPGKDAVTYGVQVTPTYEVWSDAKKHAGIVLTFTKTTGSTMLKYLIVKTLGTVKVCADGTEIEGASKWINDGNNKIIFESFTFDGTNNTPTIGTASVISIELIVDDKIVATANYSNGKQGDGVVMAYKHADTQPDAPTGTDPEYPGDGWSLSPDAATAGDKVTGVSYGGYESGTYDGNNKGTDATAKEWAEAEDDGRTWKKSPSGLSYNYGYAMMKVSFITQYDNTTVDVEIKAYSEQNYDLVEVWALDTAPDTGTTFRGQGLAHASGNGVEQAYSFTVAKAGRHFICVTYAKDISGDDNGDYGLFRLDLSDNEVAVSDTVWMSLAKVSGGKCVLPWSTPVKINGADGKGALEISVDPDILVFDTDDDGIVPSGTSKSATIACYRDGKNVTNVDYDLMEGGHPDCDASISTSNSTATVTISNIAKDKTYGVSKTSGTVEVQVYDKDNDRYYFPTVKFSVNVAKFNGGLKADNKKFESAYNYLTNKGNSTDFSYYESKIRQTAKEISLKVSEKSVGRRNMLVGSACRKYGDGFASMSGSETQYYYGYPLEQIEINNGMDGVNCIHCRTKRTGTDDYYSSGFRWWGISPQGNIKLEKGKNYVLSFYAKTPTPNYIAFVAEVLYQGSKTDTSRPNEYNGPTPHSTTFCASEADKWELFTVKVSMPSNAPYEYVEINIFARSMVDSFVDGYICKPMLEEGDEYNGWTLSEQDYDYVGGNILDDTGTLTKTGNVEVLDETTVTQGGYNNESACVKASLLPTAQVYDFLQYSTADMGLKAGEDYMLSFYARAASGYAHGELQCYLYDPSTGNVVTESSHEKINGLRNPADGRLETPITLTTAWKRYWVHWRPMGNVPKHVLFRLLRPGTNKGSYDSSTSYDVGDVVLYGGTYYVRQQAGSGHTPGASGSSSYWEATVFAIELARPKLEVGATMTEWTDKRTDMVDKRALFATGIDIENKKITLTANNTKFRGNDGKELAVIDQDGLRSSKIATTDTGHGHTVIEGNSTVWFQKDGKTPGIAVFYDAAGVPHLAFYGTDGKQKYDIGPSGLQSLISSIQQAHSDTAYLRDATSVVHTNNSTLKGFEWLYVGSGQKTDKRYIYRKQIPMTDASAQSGIYDGCVFTKEYSGTNWPNGGNLLANGWYAKPNDGNLPMKLHMADEEGVLDPTKTLYYQTFYYYEGGKVARTVRAYMRRSTKSDQLVSKFEYAMSYDEIL
nr:MAG TPA: hypothetical protein [Caudoviricetes sp.]